MCVLFLSDVWQTLHDASHQVKLVQSRKQVVDYLEPENPARKPNRKGRLLNLNGGAIALQAHDPDSIWYFKEIRIRDLD